jgi:hypothetical protein
MNWCRDFLHRGNFQCFQQTATIIKLRRIRWYLYLGVASFIKVLSSSTPRLLYLGITNRILLEYDIPEVLGFVRTTEDPTFCRTVLFLPMETTFYAPKDNWRSLTVRWSLVSDDISANVVCATDRTIVKALSSAPKATRSSIFLLAEGDTQPKLQQTFPRTLMALTSSQQAQTIETNVFGSLWFPKTAVLLQDWVHSISDNLPMRAVDNSFKSLLRIIQTRRYSWELRSLMQKDRRFSWSDVKV